MLIINQAMKEMVSKIKTVAVATSTRDGKPNVVPISFVKIFSDNQILLMDNYMNKTRMNLDSNPNVAITVWDYDLRMGYQFKGTAKIETSGPVFESESQWVKSKRPQTDPKAAIVVTIDEIYTVGSGEFAGKKLA